MLAYLASEALVRWLGGQLVGGPRQGDGMRAALVWGVGMLLGSGVALGQEVPEVQVPEHKLQVVDSGTPQPPLEEDVESPPVWDWPRQHLAAGRDFADAFLGPEIYPEVSAGIQVIADNVRPRGEVEYTSSINLQLWLLEVRIPLVSYTDPLGSDRGNDPLDPPAPPERPHVRLDLKIPFAIPGHEHHRLAFIAGTIVLDSAPSMSQSSHAALMYGYGGHGFTLQIRGGYGYDQFMPSQPLRLGLQYGGVVGVRFGWLQPMVELDGMSTTETQSDRITLVPAFRIFPGGGDSLQLGLGGLLTFSHGQDTPGKRFGGVFELSYNFL